MESVREGGEGSSGAGEGGSKFGSKKAGQKGGDNSVMGSRRGSIKGSEGGGSSMRQLSVMSRMGKQRKQKMATEIRCVFLLVCLRRINCASVIVHTA